MSITDDTMYFDGKSYLSFDIPSMSSIGAGDFTLEIITYIPVYSENITGIFTTETHKSSNDNGFGYIIAGNKFGVDCYGLKIAGMGPAYNNSWMHIVYQRNNGVIRFFLNGVTSDAYDFSGYTIKKSKCVIGRLMSDAPFPAYNDYIKGFIYNVKFSNIAIYPTSGFKAISSGLTFQEQSCILFVQVDNGLITECVTNSVITNNNVTISSQVITNITSPSEKPRSLFDSTGIYLDKSITKFSNYSNLLNVSNDLLKDETKINDILNNESDRLKLKKNSIDNAINTKKRLLLLNDSIRYRYSQYSTIMIIIIVTIIISLLLFYFRLPGLIIIIILSISIIYSLNIYYKLILKDRIDSNEKASDRIQPYGKYNNYGNTYGINYQDNVCVGQDCCSINQVWDLSSNKCHIQGFTTNDNSKSEFDNYSIYNIHNF
jgi:hypothetical protein